MNVVREEFGVEASFYHKSFKSKTFDNDIGLLKLSGQARLDRFTPVCLPSSRMTQGGVSVWITGKVAVVNSVSLIFILSLQDGESWRRILGRHHQN